MANKPQANVEVQIGFTLNKQGLSEMQNMFREIASSAETPGKNFTIGLEKAGQTARTLEGILDKTFNSNLGTLNVTKFNQELSKSNLTLSEVKKNLSGAGNQGADAYNRLAQSILGANQQLNQSSKMLDGIATTFKNVVKYNLSSAILNNFVGSIEKAFNYTKNLDKSLNDIRIVTGQSADNMAKFAETANTAAKNLGANTLDYTNAALIYYQQGLSDAEVQARAETTIKAANVTGQRGEEVSEQLTAVWNGYKITAQETEAYVDKLAAVAATTAADLEELSVGMSKVASAANAMGVDFDDLNAQIATIVSVTRQAPESVGTALKTIYARLGDLSIEGGVDEFGVSLGKVSEQMQMMGIQILDQQGNLRNMTDVIAEVAEKWDTWTEAQRQAAAVAMAGKRQYNNLIALFDNWDMYTETLNTSQDALGTLQKQQDVYMESTTAKLKTLQSTWQDLYGSLVDTSEVNKGIELLTNLVEVFDKFIESFGGGSKAILAFGSIVSSIFNKQIAESINNINQRINTFKNNLELAKTVNQIRLQGAKEGGDTARSQAIEANTKAQIEYSQKIYDARLGLNQEQTNTLINYQQEIGALTEIETLEKERTVEEEKAYIKEKDIRTILDGNYKILSEIQLQNEINIKKKEQERETLETSYQLYDQINEKVKEIVNPQKHRSFYDYMVKNVKKFINELDKLDQAQKDTLTQKIDNIANKDALLGVQPKTQAYYDIVSKQKQQLLDFMQKELGLKREDLELIEKEEIELENKRKALEKIEEAYFKINETKDKKSGYIQEVEEMLKMADSASNITQQVTAVTSAVGNLAMAWSSVNSLMDTWNDKSIDYGTKVTQTLMTLGMTIPLVIHNFTELASTFGYTTTLSEMLQASEIKRNALLQVTTINTGALTEANQVRAMAESVLNFTEVAGTDTEEERIVVDQLRNASTKETIMLLGSLSEAELINIGLTKEEAAAIIKAKIAQDSLNSSMLAFPGTWILAAIAGVAAVIAYATKKYKEYVEAIVDSNDKEIERINSIQETVNSNKELYDSYNQLYSQYKDNKIEKEELYDVTDNLVEKYKLEGDYIAKLSGNYDVLTESIRNARLEELERAKQETQKELKRAESNVLRKGQQTQQGVYNNNYNVVLEGTKAKGARKQEEFFAKTLKKNVSDFLLEDEADIVLTTSSNAKDIVKQYEEIQRTVEETENAFGAAANASEKYKNAVNYLEENKEAYEEYKQVLEELNNYEIQIIANQIDFTKATSIDEFQDKIINFKEQLAKANLNTTETVDDIVKKYISELNLTYGNIVLGIDELKKQVNDEADKYIDSLTDSQKEYLLSGKVDLTFVQTKEDIEAELQKSLNNYGTFDVSSPTSLAGTLASGTKLKKKDNEAIQQLESDVPEAMAGFDDKSTLNQLEAIDTVNNYRIEKNKEYLENWEDIEKKKQKILEDEKIHIKENADYKNLLAAEQRRDLTENEQQQLEYYKNLEKAAEKSIIAINDKLKEGLSFDEIEGIGFDSLISGIDMVTNKAEALQNAAELIGDGFTVAASDVEKFSNIFPELLENYKVLSDGSLQLDQQVVQDNIKAIQKEMEVKTEAKIQEVDQQIALKELEQEYLQEKLNNLQTYLEGKQSEQATIDAINKAGQEYEAGLMELTGQEITTLTNHAITSSNSEGGTLISMLNQVGKGFAQAAKAHYAMINGQDFDWTNLSFSGSSSSAEEYASSLGGKAQELYNKNSAMYEEIYNQAKEVQDQLNTVNGELDTLKKQKAVLESTSKASAHALDNVAAGKAGKDSKSKKSGGSKNKDKKDKEEKQWKDEFDRYWELNKAIDATDRAIQKLEKDQEKLHGQELINSLQKENELLEAQKGNYEKLLAAQQERAAALRAELGTAGVIFDASGAIVNYAEATATALAAYNKAIQDYNAGLIDETTLGVAEKAFENFKKLLEEYDKLYYTEIQETQDKLEEIARKQKENNLKAWEEGIKIKLDWKELKRGWKDFKKMMKEDFKSVYKDLRVESKNALSKAKTYTGKNGTINTDIKAIKDVEKEIDKMKSGGSSDMFESISQAQEKLKELNDQLQNDTTALHDLWKEAWQNYLDGIDQVADELDQVKKIYEDITAEIEFEGQLIELLYGNTKEGLELMSSYYEASMQNVSNQIKAAVDARDTWQQLFKGSGADENDPQSWTADQQKYYSNWKAAQQDVYDLTLQQIKLMQEDYKNTVDKIYYDQEKRVEEMKEEWEKVQKESERYYDRAERAYQIQSLENKMDREIASTTSLKAQQKLQDLRDKELKTLREKTKLREIDVKNAELEYELALKEIALEDAQRNKTSMKLTRNEQGNWTYQYVADEDDIAQKSQDLLDTYNELYQLWDEKMKSISEELIELEETYLTKSKEIEILALTNKEEAEKKRKALDEWYLGERERLYNENEEARQKLTQITAGIILKTYEQDETAYETMTDNEKNLVDSLKDNHISDYQAIKDAVDQNLDDIGDKAEEVIGESRNDWHTMAQDIIKEWNGDGASVKNQVVNAYTQCQNANNKYQEDLQKLQKQTGISFGPDGIQGALDKTKEKTDAVREATKDYADDGRQYILELKEYVGQLEEAWNSVKNAITEAIKELEEYLKVQGEAAQQAAAQAEAAQASSTSGATTTTDASGTDNGKKGGKKGTTTSNTTDTGRNYYIEGHDEKGNKVRIDDLTLSEAQSYASSYRKGSNVKVKHYDTGGYTGEWGEDGRWAILHQKELVLNKKDTENFLSGINMIRDMSSLNGSIEKSILQAVANMAVKVARTNPNSINTNNSTSNNNNTFNITAEFPNANSVDEIRQAILTLPNIASQYINQNRR